jgi:beta-lactamase superfamily II metal-dependent hydrolase
LLVLAVSSGCGVLPTPVTAQPSPSGSLVVSFTDVGQGDGVLVQSTSSESYLLDAGKA